MEFLISYIEDNDLGVYPKEILVEADSFMDCCETFYKKYPTLYKVERLFQPLADNWQRYYTHESQDQLQRSKRNMLKNLELNL